LWEFEYMRITGRVRRETNKSFSLSALKVVIALAFICVLTPACDVAFVDYGETKDEDPVWSLDGQHLAFVSYHASSSSTYHEGPLTGPYDLPNALNWTEIFLMDVDGTNRRRLTNNTVPDLDPNWSPDGSSIVFVSRRRAPPIQRGFSRQEEFNFDIFVVDVSSGKQINLTSHPADDKHPRWSPDGQLIAFISDREGSDNGDIFTMKPDGSAVTRRTSLGWVSGFNWSPDAKHLLFYSRSDGDWEIYLLGLENNALVRLTDNEVEDMRPAWSPNAQTVLFTSDRSGSNQIYILNQETMKVLQVSRDAEASWGADWSPDGRFISYVARQGANAQLRVWDSIENELMVMAENLSVNGQTPRWSPDGQCLVYTRVEDLNHDGFSEEKIWIVRKDFTGERRLSPDSID
jgi:Tol biopolymer transport system component